MKRAEVGFNRRAASIRGLGTVACAAVVLGLAPLASVLAQRVIVAPSYTTNHGWSYTSSSSAYSSYYDSTRQSPDNSCAYYGSHGYHKANCGCGYDGGLYGNYYGGNWGRYNTGRRDWADTYYQRRRLEEIERHAKKLKREDDRDREREERNARLEQERRERMDRIATLRADPEASRPQVYYAADNPSADEAVTAYFVYHQRKEAPAITRANSPDAAPRAPAPAAGLTAIGVGEWTYYYKDGEFYTLEGETLSPITAPVGALVFSLPAERKAVAGGERPVYECRGAFYQYTFVGDRGMYEVVPPPSVMADAKSY